MRPRLLALAAAVFAWAVQPAAAPPHAAPSAGGAVLYQPLSFSWWIGPDQLSLRSEAWFAGAVSSLRFRGVEFLDSSDHGRLLQGAISFDGLGECLNPTQAGASRDRPGRSTTSQLLWAGTTADSYVTATRMAYWKRPGQHCSPQGRGHGTASNTTPASDVVYAQRFAFGYRGHANAVQSTITFTTAEDRSDAVVEALTAYTPPSFESFHVFKGGRLVEDRAVAAKPGEQPYPVVLATPDGTSALGFLSLTPSPGYGRFRYPGVANKINLVFRPPGEYPAGAHVYRCVWIVGTLGEVEATLRALALDPKRKGGWTALFDRPAR